MAIPPTFRVYDSITRQANTTQYSIGDVVNGASAVPLVFRSIVSEKGKPGWILNAHMACWNVPSIAGTFYLHLYKNYITPAADNAEFAPTIRDTSEYLGAIIFDYAIKNSAITYYYASELSFLYFIPDPVLNEIYGVLQAGNAYVPASRETLHITLIGAEEL